jgi:hypothetical protein
MCAEATARNTIVSAKSFCTGVLNHSVHWGANQSQKSRQDAGVTEVQLVR